MEDSVMPNKETQLTHTTSSEACSRSDHICNEVLQEPLEDNHITRDTQSMMVEMLQMQKQFLVNQKKMMEMIAEVKALVASRRRRRREESRSPLKTPFWKEKSLLNCQTTGISKRRKPRSIHFNK